MKKTTITILLLALSYPAFAGSFPHKTAIFERTINGPMVEVASKSYVSFSKNMHDSISAEWVTQKTPMGVTHRFNLKKGDFNYSLDLDTNRCTKTNIKAVTGMVNDPEQMAKEMKKQMGLTKAGPCKGAGLKGIKYTSSFGEMCFYKEMFMIWQKAMGTTTKITKVKFDVPLPKNKTELPSGVKCLEGPDFSKGFGNMRSFDGSSSRGKGATKNRQQSPPNMEEAMKKAREAMEQYGEMFKDK